MNYRQMVEKYMKLRKKKPGAVIIIKRGIFNYLLQDQAKELASKLGLKLKIEMEISYSGEEFEVSFCGFPNAGVDKYIGRLVRLGKNVAICTEEEITEEIRLDGQV